MKESEKICAIIFDMGNVLIPYTPEDYIKEYVAKPEEVKLLREEIFQSVEWMRLDRGTLTPEEATLLIQKRLPPYLHRTAEALIHNWHKEIPPYPEMEALLQELKDLGYKLYILSNTSKLFHRFQVNIPGIRLFDGTFISADCGLLKPDPCIFRKFLETYQLPANRCFFIDDSAANVESAMTLGMAGSVFRGQTSRLRRDLRQAGVAVELAVEP